MSPTLPPTTSPTAASPHTPSLCSAHDITPKHGDIIFIRTGSIVEWETFSEQQKRDYAAQKEPQHAGVEASFETLEWIWDSGIAALAGDSVSWEVFPTPGDVSMHEYLLAGWGCPIGEIFGLEALAQKCIQLGRYNFFLPSMPLNMPSGVSSPPNAMAIFYSAPPCLYVRFLASTREFRTNRRA